VAKNEATLRMKSTPSKLCMRLRFRDDSATRAAIADSLRRRLNRARQASVESAFKRVEQARPCAPQERK
jgi:hypothetical protein